MLVISKGLAAALAAIATWGAASLWDQNSTNHSRCREANPDHNSYIHEAEIGLGLAIAMPKRWRGPAVTVWFGSAALVHARAADANQNYVRAGLCPGL